VVESATGDTWGISGSTFLTCYFLIAALVGFGWLRTRVGAITAPRAKSAPTDLTRRPHELAYLNGGAPLAVLSSLTALRLRGSLSASRGQVHATGRLEPGADGLERAIHAAATKPVHRSKLPQLGPVPAALDEFEQRLVRAGLLVPDAVRRRIRQLGLVMGAVAVLGVLRLVAGLPNGKPVGLLSLLLLAVIAATVAMLIAVPRRTRLGDRTLATLRSGRHDLDPASRPDWVVYGPAGAALGIGLFGVGALWASDPAMASELEAQKAAAAGGSSGGGFSGDGGGDSGGSSCGGGGCGGGCGG